MTYLYTNILVYSVIEDFDPKKHIVSKDVIIDLITKNTLFISPMVISELIYVLSKSGIDRDIISEEITLFSKYVKCSIDKDIVTNAFELTNLLNRNSSINDGIHVKLAERYCTNLITFDKGYETFVGLVSLDIEIL